MFKSTKPPSSGRPSYAYAEHGNEVNLRDRLLKVSLVMGDCCLIGIQPILVHMSKNDDGKFNFDPVSVNFLTELAKCFIAILLLIYHDGKRNYGERSLLSWYSIQRAARTNLLLMVPALFYAINNYLKFAMQLHFKPATTKMLGNLKVLTIALLMKLVLKRTFTVTQWEALVLLLLGITVNQLACNNNTNSTPIPWFGWIYTLMSVTIPSAASVYNELALKSNYETNFHLQNFYTYFYGAVFNLVGLLLLYISRGGEAVHLLEGHSSVTFCLIINNAAQGILSSFFFKYADTILKKYSSTVATIFTGILSALLFNHHLTINFFIGVSIVFISMHLFFSTKDVTKQRAYPRTSSEAVVAAEHDIAGLVRQPICDLPR